jgi:hypothetical protein
VATQADIDADLTLEIDGHNVTPDKFMRGARAFFGLINEITRSLAREKEFIIWQVQVKDASNLIGVAPGRFTVPPSVIEAVYARVQESIETIENEATEPEGIPEAALRHVKDLASIVGTNQDDDTRVRVWTKKNPLAVTHRAVAHVAVLLNEAFEDFGTIEGRVQVISDQGDLHVFITEPIRYRRVRCFFDENLLPDFLAAFRKRVEVSGRIKYRRDGVPISIYATELLEFPPATELPSFREMRGIFREGA